MAWIPLPLQLPPDPRSLQVLVVGRKPRHLPPRRPLLPRLRHLRLILVRGIVAVPAWSTRPIRTGRMEGNMGYVHSPSHLPDCILTSCSVVKSRRATSWTANEFI